MPQIFRIGSYIVYFWSNENNPLEPIHYTLRKEKQRQAQQKFG